MREKTYGKSMVGVGGKDTEIFKRYGVEVVRHRFDEEKGKYVIVGVKSEREDLWDTVYGR